MKGMEKKKQKNSKKKEIKMVDGHNLAVICFIVNNHIQPGVRGSATERFLKRKPKRSHDLPWKE